MKPIRKYIFISAISFFGIFTGVAVASATCNLTLTPSSGGPGNVTVTANYNAFHANINGTETYVDIDWGDGNSFSRTCSGGSCIGSTTHVYNSTRTTTLFCSNDDGPPLPGSPWSAQVSRTFTYNGGGQPGYQCSNNVDDDDGDVDVDMNDCGCTGPTDANEADAACGGQPNWIHIIVNINATNPNVIGWKLICPPGSYTCVNPRGSQNGTVAYGTGPEQSNNDGGGDPYFSTWDACKNGKCAGQGTYKLIPSINGAGCVGQTKTIYNGTHLVSLTIDCLGGGGGGNPSVDLTCRDPNTNPGSQIQGPCKVPFSDNDWLAWTSSNANVCNAYVNGPVAYWPMDELNDGDIIADITGTGYNATAGGLVTVATGRFGNARNFAGTGAGNGSAVTQGRFLPLQNVNQASVTGWINQPVFNSGIRHIIGVLSGTGGDGNDTIQITTAGTTGQLRIYRDRDNQVPPPGGSGLFGMANTTGGPAMIPGQWHHFAFVWDGFLSGPASKAQVFIDGLRRPLVFTGNWAGTDLRWSAWRGTMGAPLGGLRNIDEILGSPFQGLLDDVRVYDYPLSAAQIQAEAGVAGPTPLPFPGQGPGWPGANPILTSQADPPGYQVGPITATHSFGITCVGPGGSSSDSVLVGVGAGAGNRPPTALNVTQTEPSDYCTSGPGGIISWTFSDPDGDDQSQYQVQIDDDSNFGSPVINQTVVSAANSYPIPSGILQFNRRYYVRVQVWDDAVPPNPSGFVLMSLCFGPGCDPTLPQTYWDTPINQYPQAGFIYTPTNPAQNQLVSFTDTTGCYDADGLCNSWSWNFGDGGISGLQNPQHAYTADGNYTVNLTTSDVNGYACSTQQTISVKKGIPYWIEVLPQ